jgi:hypothetical protein
MFINDAVTDTSYEVECEGGIWIVVSYVKYANGRRIRNWVAEGPSQAEAYVVVNRLRNL